MAVEQVNSSDYDYDKMLATQEVTYIGKAEITISEYDSTAACVVKVGSKFEVNGALFKVLTADETPTGYSGVANSTTFYIYWDVSGEAFIFSSVAPTWSDALQGWYNGNDRAFFSMYKDSGGTLYQWKTSLIQKSREAYQVIHVQDQKAATTEGGTFTSGSWQTRVLNTVLTNTITGASLASNQITLPSGIYKIYSTSPALRVSAHKAKLYNITDTEDTIVGSSEYSNNAATYDVTVSRISGIFSITAAKVFEIQHYGLATYATSGFGIAGNFSVIEVYTDTFIEKIG